MHIEPGFKLINKQTNYLLFSLGSLEENCFCNQIQRNNYFSLVWVTEGAGKIKTGFSEYDFPENTLFALAPFQPFLFFANTPIKGIVINFQPEFIFANQQDKENDFKQVLFNNVSHPPFVIIDKSATAVFNMLVEKIETEIQNTSMAQNEILSAYLQILLINASRIKIEQHPHASGNEKKCKEHYILQKLKDAIEENFRIKHTPGEYATMLYVTAKTLSRVSKSYYNKTVSCMINERIITEAKRELYLTNKAVKKIAYELGYDDEYYFSRFFKVNAQVSPQKYRETAGYKAA